MRVIYNKSTFHCCELLIVKFPSTDIHMRAVNTPFPERNTDMRGRAQATKHVRNPLLSMYVTDNIDCAQNF